MKTSDEAQGRTNSRARRPLVWPTRLWLLVAFGLGLAATAGACSDRPSIERSEVGTGATGTGGVGAIGSESGGRSSTGTGGTVLIDAGDEPDGRIDPDAGCASSVVTGDLKPAHMLFVVDQSGSMNCNLPEDGQTTAECEAFPVKEDPGLPSKWELTRAALEQAFDALQSSGVEASVGLSMFPVASSLCDVVDTPAVPVAPLDDAHNSALDAFLATVEPSGNTPLAGATILSYAHLFDQLKAGAFEGNVFVVLLTDGFETCKLDELAKLLDQDVPNAHELLGIRTFVIGAPGSEEARSLLSRIAWAGGTPATDDCVHSEDPPELGDCHFDMTESQDFAADLASALEQISGTVLTCELDVPTNPTGGGVDLNQVNVDINEAPYDRVDCAPGESGWQYNDDKTRIILCGAACDAAKQENASVSIVLGCPTRIPE